MICAAVFYLLVGLGLAVTLQRADPVAPGDEAVLVIMVLAWLPCFVVVLLTFPLWWVGRYIARLAAAL